MVILSRSLIITKALTLNSKWEIWKIGFEPLTQLVFSFEMTSFTHLTALMFIMKRYLRGKLNANAIYIISISKKSCWAIEETQAISRKALNNTSTLICYWNSGWDAHHLFWLGVKSTFAYNMERGNINNFHLIALQQWNMDKSLLLWMAFSDWCNASPLRIHNLNENNAE